MKVIAYGHGLDKQKMVRRRCAEKVNKTSSNSVFSPYCDIASSQDNRNAFFFACEYCHKSVAEFLVGQIGVNVNDQDISSGHSALHRLCIAGQTREAKVR